MTTIDLNAATVERPGDRFERDEAELAAASFLARYSGRTLEAYRHDLRGFFQWADNHSRYSRPHARTSNCSAPGWNTASLPRRRSTGASQRCAASAASPTATADRIEPSPVRSPPAGPPNRRTRTRPLRARRVPVHRRALRPPATPTPEPPRSTTTAAKTSTATPPTSSSPSSPAG
jgi:hypothetical protein